MSELREKPRRRYELDWLKVLVILNLIPYHAVEGNMVLVWNESIDSSISGNLKG